MAAGIPHVPALVDDPVAVVVFAVARLLGGAIVLGMNGLGDEKQRDDPRADAPSKVW